MNVHRNKASFGFFLLLALGVFAPVADASAVITLDDTTAASGSGDSMDESHTVANDANGMVVPITFWDCDGGDVAIDSMTFNGDALTLAKRHSLDYGSCGEHAEIWYLASPDTGTHDLEIEFSGTTGGAGGVIVSLKGFAQTGQPDATAEGDELWCSDPDSDNITVVTDDSWVFDAASAPGTFGSPSGSQTQLESMTISYEADASSGSVAMGWGYTGCHGGPHALASFSPGPTVNYVASEGHFIGGGGDASSSNFEIKESAFDQFATGNLASVNYAAETKIGIGGAGIASITTLTPSNFAKFYHDQNASYTVTAVSQDGDSLQYSAKQDSTTKVSAQSSSTLTWSLSSSDIGRHTISLSVIDPQGTTLKKQETYVVRRPTK